MFARLRRDIGAVYERDPACRSVLEVLLCYPGFHAIQAHRVSHFLQVHRLPLLARLVSQLSRWLTGIEIHPGAVIGEGFFIDHGMGVVIGETAEVGNDCTLYQGATLGGTGKEKGKRHPTLGNGVMVGVGAKVLGAITVGDNAKVGAGAVVVDAVPPNCTVVGIPGRVVVRDGQRVGIPDLDHGNLPDPVADALIDLQRHVQRLEMRLAEAERALAAMRTAGEIARRRRAGAV